MIRNCSIIDRKLSFQRVNRDPRACYVRNRFSLNPAKYLRIVNSEVAAMIFTYIFFLIMALTNRAVTHKLENFQSSILSDKAKGRM